MTHSDYLPKIQNEAYFLIADKATKTLQRLADGNGLKSDNIRLVKQETTVHQIPAFISVHLKPVIKESEIRGQAPQGDVFASKQEILQRLEGLTNDFSKAPAVLHDIEKICASDPGLGWGMEHKSVLLSETKKTLSYVDKCLKCNGLAETDCTTCFTQGVVQCATCFGQGVSACTSCVGSGFVQGGDGHSVNCTRCNGQGRLTCTGCNGQKTMRCRFCNGIGRIACIECNKSGYWTHVYSIQFSAEIDFHLELKETPPEIRTIIDKIGVRACMLEKHIDLFTIPPDMNQKEINLPLVAFLPVAQAVFAVEGKETPATIAGLHGHIIEIDLFLDKAVKPGIVALSKISKGPMAVDALVTTACKYKLLRMVLGGLMQDSKKIVYQRLTKEYSVVLSDKYARAAVSYAQNALLTLSRVPRIRGLCVGTLLSAGLSAGYFMTPARAMVLSALQPYNLAEHILIADVLVWVIGYLMSFFTIRLFAAHSLKRILPFQDQTRKIGRPPAGSHGLTALATTFAAWIIFAFVAVDKPLWVLTLLRFIPNIAALIGSST